MMWSTVKMLLALKCDESTRLVSESMDRDLPRVERWAIRLHAISCRSCRRFRRQVEFMLNALSQRGAIDAGGLESDPRLSDSARARITRAIADRSSENSS